MSRGCGFLTPEVYARSTTLATQHWPHLQMPQVPMAFDLKTQILSFEAYLRSLKTQEAHSSGPYISRRNTPRGCLSHCGARSPCPWTRTLSQKALIVTSAYIRLR